MHKAHLFEEARIISVGLPGMRLWASYLLDSRQCVAVDIWELLSRNITFPISAINIYSTKETLGLI